MSDDKNTENDLENQDNPTDEEGVIEDSSSIDSEEEYYEDDDLSEDDWDEYDFEDDVEGEDFSEAKAGKSSRFNQILIGSAVVVGLGFVFISLGGEGTSPSPDPMTEESRTVAAPSSPSAQENLPDADKSELARQQGGMLTNPGLLNSVEKEAKQAYEEEEFAYVEKDGGQELAFGRGAYIQFPDSVEDKDDQAEILTPMPTSQESPEEKNISGESSVREIADVEAPGKGKESFSGFPRADDIIISADATGDDMQPDHDLADLSQNIEKLDSIASKLDKLSTRLGAVETRMVRFESDLKQVGSKANNTELKEVMRAIKAVEKRIDSLAREDSITSMTESSPTVNVVPKDKPETPGKMISEKRDVQPHVQRPIDRAEKELNAERDWDLKSAVPGRAWLSQKQSGDVRSVSVGDALPGLGTITAIDIRDGKWVVQGQKGEIVQ